MTYSIPSFYVIGDIQGCAGALRDLLRQIPPDSPVWFCGDLVNRGPDSLGVLQVIHAMGDRARVVLGNHDIHLLAVAAGARKLGKSDTIQDILDLPNRQFWLDWLRHQPMVVYEHGVLMSHAGIHPSWSLTETLSYASELERLLASDQYEQHLQTLFGNEPNQWSNQLTGNERLRVITNVLTRMRALNSDWSLNYTFKAQMKDMPTELSPWFSIPKRTIKDTPIFFGHWSALGLMQYENATCLDTGCVWGNELTAYHYPSGKVLTAREPSL